MGDFITEWFVAQYTQGWSLTAQQEGSLLRNAVRVETGIVGKDAYFDTTGSVTARKRTSRHADMPLMPTPHSRRKLSLSDYDLADLIDTLDKAKTLNDPTNSIVQAQGFAMGRSMDEEIIAAARATSYYGEAGASSIALPTAQKVAHGSAGMTLAKLISARSILGKGNVNDKNPENKLYMAISQEQLDDMLAIEELTSADYAAVRALVAGEINQFMGFEFIKTQLLPKTTYYRYCLAWAKSGLCLGIGVDIKGSIDRRTDKAGLPFQASACMSIGATRMEEAKVVEVCCMEDASA